MKIRKFIDGDLCGVCDLINLELGYKVIEKDLEERIRLMRKDKNYRIFVAIDNKKILGFIGLQLCLAFEIPDRIMRIIALAVAHDAQNQGLGSKLIFKAEHYARENKISTIVVNSGLKRTSAHQFYEKNSFYQKGYSFCKKLNSAD